MTYEDLLRILLESNPGLVLKERQDDLANLINEFAICIDYDQKCPTWHPHKLMDHILIALNNTEPNLIIRLSVLFHDIGKPYACVEDERGRHFPNHWNISADIFKKYALNFNLSNTDLNTIEKLIRNHEEHFEYKNEEEQQEFIDRFNADEIEMLYKIKIADHMGQSGKAQDLIPMLIEQKKYILDKIENKKVVM